MKIKELLEILRSENPDREVILSSDGEGNNYSPLYCCNLGNYSSDSESSGQVGLEKLTEEDKEAGYTEEDILKGKPVIVLYPTN